ncbi:hypothetical protein EDB86DRAFT_2333302 [Lactarius hatsudake]|nr:hypothetical protein EDB86DRAFT_2333302 [Lactarius hatsudake]
MKSQGLLPWQSSREDIRISSGHSSQLRVHFQILTSPTHRLNSKTLIFELGTEVKITEVLWIFARLPVNHRIAPRDAPHFYLNKDLPDRPLTYTKEFRLEPLKDLRPENDQNVLVLLDHPRTGRIFFECGKFYKTYTNIWKPHNTVILKDLQGTIEAATRIGPMIHGEIRIWKRGTTQFPLQLTAWTEVLDLALHRDYLHVDWLIRTETSPSEAIAIEFTWVRMLFFSPYAWSSTYQVTRNAAVLFPVFLSKAQRPSPRTFGGPCHLHSKQFLPAHLILPRRVV